MKTRRTMLRPLFRSIAITTILVVLLAGQAALAEPVREGEVRTAVETWVRHVTADARPDAIVVRMQPHTVDGTVVAYVVHLDNGGYCISGADDRLLPVYLYNPVGPYEPENPNYRIILDEVATRYAMIEKATVERDPVLNQYRDILDERASQWRDLRAQRIPPGPDHPDDRNGPAMMTLPVTSYWHQGAPYNHLCPTLIPNGTWHTVVGCVGTTAAQIMYYWNWPNTGVGSHSVEYNRRWREDTDWDFEPLATDPQLEPDGLFTSRLYWTPDSGGRLYMSGYWDGSIFRKAKRICNNGVDCGDNNDYQGALAALWDRMPRDPETCFANFGATTYNYSIMQDDHSGPPNPGNAEVAKLSYHAGIAVGMNYGVLGSGAGSTRDAMVDHFRYDSSANREDRDVNKMVEDIQWLRPHELTGYNGGGHSWVVCGYNTAVSPYQFLMNLGWGGGSTQWYSVDQVFPNDQETTTRLAPYWYVRFVGGSSGGDGTPSAPYQNLSTALSNAPDNATLIFKAGTTNILTGSSAGINKPLKLIGQGVTITRSGS